MDLNIIFYDIHSNVHDICEKMEIFTTHITYHAEKERALLMRIMETFKSYMYTFLNTTWNLKWTFAMSFVKFINLCMILNVFHPYTVTDPSKKNNYKMQSWIEVHIIQTNT